MSAAAELLSHVVGNRSYVGARGYAGTESGLIGGDGQNLEFLNFNGYGSQHDFFFLAGKFVGGDSGDLLGGKGRRRLFDGAAKVGGEGAHVVEVQENVLGGSRGL